MSFDIIFVWLFHDFSISYIDALLIIGLPNGPTAHFKLSNLVLRKDIKVHVNTLFFSMLSVS